MVKIFLKIANKSQKIKTNYLKYFIQVSKIENKNEYMCAYIFFVYAYIYIIYI